MTSSYISPLLKLILKLHHFQLPGCTVRVYRGTSLLILQKWENWLDGNLTKADFVADVAEKTPGGAATLTGRGKATTKMHRQKSLGAVFFSSKDTVLSHGWQGMTGRPWVTCFAGVASTAFRCTFIFLPGIWFLIPLAWQFEKRIPHEA